MEWGIGVAMVLVESVGWVVGLAKMGVEIVGVGMGKVECESGEEYESGNQRCMWV